MTGQDKSLSRSPPLRTRVIKGVKAAQEHNYIHLRAPSQTVRKSSSQGRGAALSRHHCHCQVSSCLLSCFGSPEVTVQRAPIKSITAATVSLQEEVSALSLSPRIISLCSRAAYCCARLFPPEPRKSGLLHSGALLLTW